MERDQLWSAINKVEEKLKNNKKIEEIYENDINRLKENIKNILQNICMLKREHVNIQHEINNLLLEKIS